MSVKIKKIAVTGSIASGKSLVTKFFEEFGAYCLDCDAIVHELLQSKGILKNQIIDLLGEDVVIDHQISRENVAKKVFNDPRKLGELENLIHPIVSEKIQRTYQKAAEESLFALFVVEVPLLFESGMDPFFDRIICVVSEEHLAKKRCKKSHYDLRKKRLKPLEEKISQADFVIENNGSKQELKEKTHHVYEELMNL